MKIFANIFSQLVAYFLSSFCFCYHTPLLSVPSLSLVSIVSILVNFDYIPRRFSVWIPDHLESSWG